MSTPRSVTVVRRLREGQRNRAFIWLGAIGIVLVAAAGFYEALVHDSLAAAMRATSEQYAELLASHENLIVAQNGAILNPARVEASLRTGDFVHDLVNSNVAREAYVLTPLSRLRDHACKIIGANGCRTIAESAPPYPSAEDAVPALHPFYVAITVGAYERLDAQRTALQLGRRRSRWIFVVVFVVGSLLTGIGALRREGRTLSRVSIRKCVGALLVLSAWLVQSTIHDRLKERQDAITETRHLRAGLDRTEDLYLQSIELIAAGDTSAAVFEKRRAVGAIHGYLRYHPSHVGRLLAGELSPSELKMVPGADSFLDRQLAFADAQEVANAGFILAGLTGLWETVLMAETEKLEVVLLIARAAALVLTLVASYFLLVAELKES